MFGCQGGQRQRLSGWDAAKQALGLLYTCGECLCCVDEPVGLSYKPAPSGCSSFDQASQFGPQGVFVAAWSILVCKELWCLRALREGGVKVVGMHTGVQSDAEVTDVSLQARLIQEIDYVRVSARRDNRIIVAAH